MSIAIIIVARATIASEIVMNVILPCAIAMIMFRKMMTIAKAITIIK